MRRAVQLELWADEKSLTGCDRRPVVVLVVRLGNLYYDNKYYFLCS